MKWDLYKRKETHEMRPMYMTRDQWKETYVHQKRNVHIYEKRWVHEKRHMYIKKDLWMQAPETCEGARLWKETYTHMEKKLCTWRETCVHEKRPVYMKRDLWRHAQETCHGAQDHICSKRPHTLEKDLWKETCEGMPKRPATELKIISVLNVLILWKKTYEKKPLHIWKETCVHAKRPVYMKRDLWRHAQSTAKELEIVSVLNVFMLWKETCEKKPIHLYIYEKRPAHVKRDL